MTREEMKARLTPEVLLKAMEAFDEKWPADDPHPAYDALRDVLLDALDAVAEPPALPASELLGKMIRTGREAAAAAGVESGDRPPSTGTPVYGSEVLCPACAITFCPTGEPLHFHHDGCPGCDTASGERPPAPPRERT